MEIIDKFVEFENYCKICKYKNVDHYCDPCNECLTNPTNVQSKIPVKYEEDEKLVKEEKKKEAAKEK